MIIDKLESFLGGFPSNSSFSATEIDGSSLGIKPHQLRSLANCFFEYGVRLNSPAMPGYGKCFVGAYSYMGSGGYMQNCFIGRYCSIGKRVSVGASMHSISNLSTYPGISKKSKLDSPVIIGNDVWIGDGAVIMSGVKIGTGSVVGANAVVTKNVEPYAVVGGVPARHIKYRVPENLHVTLLDSCWWEMSREALEAVKGMNLEECIAWLSNNDKTYSSYPTYKLAP